MANITLETVSYKDCTIGRLFTADFDCFTLELPWRNNQINVSCYPSGVYEYKKRFSPSKQMEVIELINVPDRTYIQIHVGNFTRQVKGCTMVGDGIGYLNTDSIPDVENSEDTFNLLMGSVPSRGLIHVIRHGV